MIDLIALFPKMEVQGEMMQRDPHTIQCKDDKREYDTMTKLEKMLFIQYCEERGAIPVLAVKMRKSERFPDGIAFDYLLQVKLEMMGDL